MRMYDIILKKRDGGELSEKEISFIIEQYTAEAIPDYQVSALLMAIYFQGLSERETLWLTDRMAKSGDMMDLSEFGNLSVDKHSTGGVGDKTSLIVGPVVATLGGKVTKMSGRGLGHTGGTVDKLESIPGFKTTMSPSEFVSQVKNVGIALIGQSGNLTPADKKLYALRDVTATVDNIGLIASSIMSKKLAAGSRNIVLDVKVGSGAFMKTISEAEKLAQMMVDIGKNCGRNMAAVLTNMDIPLGKAIGNALEVQEAVSVLKGEQKDELYEVCVTLASQMISLVYDIPEDEAREKVETCIANGSAFDTMKKWITAQGGDATYLDDFSKFKKAKFCTDVISTKDAYIEAMDAQKIGSICVMLGAGRAAKDDVIDHTCGIILNKTRGDKVTRGEKLCTLYASSKQALECASEQFLNVITWSDKTPADTPVVYRIIR